ncbi:MAG: signal peptidase I [Propionibacteriaceae bacterium]|nr:signal peptidase I [Propionibacteriaceae bacterium]
MRIARRISLSVICVLGAISLIAFGIMLAFGIRPIMVASGSMEPAIPTGALAFDRAVPANQVAVGDIVTVKRTGGDYVTHRVVAVAEGPEGLTQLTLKGDANGQNDPTPYLVSEVGKHLGSIPWLGYAAMWVRNNWVIAAILFLALAAFSFSGGPRVSVVMPDGSVVKGLTRTSAKRLVESVKATSGGASAGDREGSEPEQPEPVTEPRPETGEGPEPEPSHEPILEAVSR